MACDQPMGYKLLENLMGTGSDDCNDMDSNLTAIGNGCDDGDPETVNDLVTISCTCEGVLPIPTLSQWGLMILGLSLSIAGTVGFMKWQPESN